jgi:hypothetical protein
MQEEPYCSIFLFVNSSSGGGLGNKLIQQEVIIIFYFRLKKFNLKLESLKRQLKKN